MRTLWHRSAAVLAAMGSLLAQAAEAPISDFRSQISEQKSAAQHRPNPSNLKSEISNLKSAAEVRAELLIPPAETYVIGDVIPLYWRFVNLTPQPLAFMWEGCCRLNGRLTVIQNGKVVEGIPQGQPLAHMFAKAERMDPQKPRDMDTRVSDWLILPGTGTYDLQGRYTGVLPTQRPQVARGLMLWTNSAETPSIRLSVLSVDDYLKQREKRSKARGLSLELQGAPAIPKLTNLTYTLRIRNTGTTAKSVTWPNDFSLWFVNTQGQRLGSQATAVDGEYTVLNIAPGATLEQRVAFHSDRIEGEPLGAYRVFIDLATASSDKPRVPSTDIPVRWELTPWEIADLLQRASSGHRTGARNAPLKLLRVYLGDIAPSLSKIDTAPLSPEAKTIWEQLAFAASLKPLATKPGRVDLAVAVPANNGPTPFASATLKAIAAMDAKQPLAQRLEKIVSVRRHLGWELAVAFEPAANTRIDRLFSVAKEAEPLQDQFATAPRIVLAPISTNTPPSVTLHAVPIPAAVTLRCDKGKVAISQDGQTFHALSDIAALESWLTANTAVLTSPTIQILATPETVWSQVAPWLEPFRQRNWSPDLSVAQAVSLLSR